MLQDLHIKGFKCFRDFQLTDISRVMLVSGKNNIGKTSLLESISLFYNTADPEWLFRHLRWRDISISFTDTEGLFSPIFTDFNMDNSIAFEVKDGIYVAKMNIQCKPSNVQKAVSADISEVGDCIDPSKTDAITETSYQMNIHYEVSGGDQEDVTIVLRRTQSIARIQFEPHPVTIVPPEMLHNITYLPLRSKIDFHEEARRFGQLDIKRKTDRVVTFLQVIEPQLIGLTLTMFAQKPTIYADIQGKSLSIFSRHERQRFSTWGSCAKRLLASRT